MTMIEQGNYMLEFLNTYSKFTNQEKGEREAACLEVQHKRGILPIEDEDLLCGRYIIPCIGFAMQDYGMGYYLDEVQFKELLACVPYDMQKQLDKAVKRWKYETGKEQLIQKMPDHIRELIPNDRFDSESNVGFWLCRMSSTQLDFDKLLRLGLGGLINEIHLKHEVSSDSSEKTVYRNMIQALNMVQTVILFHQDQLRKSNHPHGEKLADILKHIAYNKPESFHQAVQLMYLYAIISGTYNYGRMDEYLGDFLSDDLLEQRITKSQAKDILICLWKLMIQRKTTWNARVIIGGMGRRNEENADLCARLILEVAADVRDVLPQLSLRFDKKQNPELLDFALSIIGSGCVYPILYNDDVNIPAVQQAFQVSYQEAIHYIPYGCGEYILYHRSVGTPSDVINLLKALEITLFDGYDFVSKKQIGLKTGRFTDFNTFEEFFNSYCMQVERYVEVEAQQQRFEYKTAEMHSPFLLASILYDDCIMRGKYIFGGGVIYLGGTLEIYGNTNTADSLTAIKKLIFDEGKISKQELLDMILADFKGYEKQRILLCVAPKYGNDNVEADEMAEKVHNHICHYTRSQAERVGLDTYLAVIINNSANTSMGTYTLASSDGRKAYEPMANANNPSGGNDVNGLTAVLNSLVKLSTEIHAGSVQNIKFSKEMFTTYLEKTKAVLMVYFDQGGSQMMINVLGKADLEQAIKEPDQYKNLIVRVGGFCARFIELEPKVQQEIMSRTMY